MSRPVKAGLIGFIAGGLLGVGLSTAGAPIWFVVICCIVLGAAIGWAVSY